MLLANLLFHISFSLDSHHHITCYINHTFKYTLRHHQWFINLRVIKLVAGPRTLKTACLQYESCDSDICYLPRYVFYNSFLANKFLFMSRLCFSWVVVIIQILSYLINITHSYIRWVAAAESKNNFNSVFPGPSKFNENSRWYLRRSFSFETRSIWYRQRLILGAEEREREVPHLPGGEGEGEGEAVVTRGEPRGHEIKGFCKNLCWS